MRVIVDGVAFNVSDAEYKVYIASIIGVGLMGPMVTDIYENTIGDIVWSMVEDGNYVGTLAGAFVEGKTYLAATNLVYPTVEDAQIASLQWINANSVRLVARNMTTASLGPMTTVNIEIRVYN